MEPAAALGMTEESDAVVLVVSEETGAISLARGGQLNRDIAPDQIEDELRATLTSKGRLEAGRGTSVLLAVIQFLRRDAIWLAGSLLLAWGAWFAAHQSIRGEDRFLVHVRDAATVGRRTPKAGELLVLTPDENSHARTEPSKESFYIWVAGSKGQLTELGGALRGTFEIDDPSWRRGPLDLSQVRWENGVLGVEYRWGTATPPELVVERTATRRLQLQGSDVVVDASGLESRFEARLGDIRFDPGPSISVTGPESLVEKLFVPSQIADPEERDALLAAGGQPLALAPIVLERSDRDEVRERLRLVPELRAKNLSLTADTSAYALVPILPRELVLGTLRKDIALVCLSTEKQDLLPRWRLPANAHTVALKIVTSGLIGTDVEPGSPAFVERQNAIQRFVEENLRVYVDVAELPPPEEGRSVAVHLAWVKDWRDYPEVFSLDEDKLGDWEDLTVRLLDEGDRFVLLEPRADAQETP